jgi:hypothetical protein
MLLTNRISRACGSPQSPWRQMCPRLGLCRTHDQGPSPEDNGKLQVQTLAELVSLAERLGVFNGTSDEQISSLG